MLPPLQFHRFQVGGQNLYGTLHLPEGDGPFPAVVMCHGFTGHRIESSWVFVKAAKRIAAAGIAAFRFDCRGSGESDGAFVDMTISSEVEDATAAVRMVAGLPEIDASRLALLGFSMGGTVASEAAARCKADLPAPISVRTLCLWSPVGCPVEQFARFAKMTGASMDAGPDIVGRGFAEDLANHEPAEAAKQWGGPLCVIRGTADPVILEAHARRYMDAPAPRKWVPIEGADHGWANAEHQRQLYAATVDWLRETV